MYGLEVNLISITGSCSNLFTYKHFCRFFACIQNQIIHKHVHVDYDPLKGMLVFISSLKLSIVITYAAGPESQGHSRTALANISMSSCLPSFIVRWILNFVDQPTHENHENWYPTNKCDFTVLSCSYIVANCICKT